MSTPQHPQPQQYRPQQYAPQRPVKDVTIAYLLLIFLGLIGVHQFYLGKVGRGLLYLFTLGGFGVLVLVDLFTLPSQVRQVNAQIVSGVR